MVTTAASRLCANSCSSLGPSVSTHAYRDVESARGPLTRTLGFMSSMYTPWKVAVSSFKAGVPAFHLLIYCSLAYCSWNRYGWTQNITCTLPLHPKGKALGVDSGVERGSRRRVLRDLWGTSWRLVVPCFNRRSYRSARNSVLWSDVRSHDVRCC